MSGRLEGKVAIVVGAGSSGDGLSNGAAAALLYAREGARVLCADRSLPATARDIAAWKTVVQKAGMTVD